MAQEEFGTAIQATMLVEAWQVLVKRKLTVLVFAALAVVIVGLLSATSTPYYRSRAQVEISPKAPVVLEGLTDVAPSVNPFQVQQYFATQHRFMQSTGVLNEAARVLVEEHGVTDFQESKNPAGWLGGLLKIVPISGTHLVSIEVEYTDPDKAALFANVIAQAYVSHNLVRSQQLSAEALSYIEGQRIKYRQMKRDAEVAVEAFKADRGLLSASDRTATEEMLLRLQGSLSDVYSRRVVAESRMRGIESQLKTGRHLALAEALSADPVIAQLLLDYQAADLAVGTLLVKYRPGHPDVQAAESRRAAVEAQVARQVRQELEGERAQVRLLLDEETSILENLATLNGAKVDQSRDVAELRDLQREAKQYGETYENLDKRYEELKLQQFVQANNVWQVERAVPLRGKVRPKVLNDVITAGLVGLILGSLLAFALEFLDTSVRGADDVERISGLPALGTIPIVDAESTVGLASERDRHVVTFALPRSLAAESLRTIRTTVQFRAGTEPLRRLLITSSTPKEGKSFVSSNLAAVIAMGGKRVLLIDGDLRRPSIQERFQISNKAGLSDVLLHGADWRPLVITSHIPGLDVLPAGRATDNPAELLARDDLADVFAQFQGYDLVVIDSPPLSAVSDALVLAQLVDGVVFVVQAHRTSAAQVRHSLRRLVESGAKVFGAVINKQDRKQAGPKYGYYYDYGYYGSDSETATKKKRVS